MGGIAKCLGPVGAALLAGPMLAGAAWAQAPRPTPPRVARPPVAPGDTASHGVIKPPRGIDPGIHATPPETGPMPVIPPPGMPGGEQGIVPR